MARKYLGSFLIGLVFVFGVVVPVHAQTAPSIEELVKIVNELTAQVVKLQAQMKVMTESQTSLATQMGNVLQLKQEVRKGMTGEEVSKLQKILATDATLYPEGLVTGFYGPLTAQAVERLQTKFKLETRGEVDAATLALINKFLEASGSGEQIPADLFTAGAQKVKIEIKEKNGKLEYKFEIKCDNSGKGNTCKDEDDDEDDLNEDDDEDDDDIDEDEDDEEEDDEDEAEDDEDDDDTDD